MGLASSASCYQAIINILLGACRNCLLLPATKLWRLDMLPLDKRVIRSVSIQRTTSNACSMHRMSKSLRSIIPILLRSMHHLPTPRDMISQYTILRQWKSQITFSMLQLGKCRSSSLADRSDFGNAVVSSRQLWIQYRFCFRYCLFHSTPEESGLLNLFTRR